MKRIKSTIDMMNMVVDNSITETPEFTGQFMVFPKSFGSEDEAQKTLSRMSREQLAAFLKAESGNAQKRPFMLLLQPNRHRPRLRKVWLSVS